MDIIYLLIIISIILVAVIAGVLLWAIHSGQYEDMDKYSHQILMEEDDSTEDDSTGDEDPE